MKKALSSLLLALLMLLCGGCHSKTTKPDIVATTLPIYTFTSRLCAGTDLTVEQLITENVSCLHDYSLTVSQMEKLEGANLVVLNGAGLEEFMEDALSGVSGTIFASEETSHHSHDNYEHSSDAHIWLSPENAKAMARNICAGLCRNYPQHAPHFENNLTDLLADLDALQAYGKDKLSNLSCRELITFHDGFCAFADCFGLNILRSVEEEAGSEASAKDLIELVELVNSHQLPAIFIEANGADAAAKIISAETGANVFVLDMAISGDSYFDSMYRNIDTIWEALQ